jgi:hypothetical protein
MTSKSTSSEHWNHHLATPAVPLVIQLETGEVIRGIRPTYIESREQGDQGYRTHDGKIISNVKGWIYDT